MFEKLLELREKRIVLVLGTQNTEILKQNHPGITWKVCLTV